MQFQVWCSSSRLVPERDGLSPQWLLLYDMLQMAVIVNVCGFMQPERVTSPPCSEGGHQKLRERPAVFAEARRGMIVGKIGAEIWQRSQITNAKFITHNKGDAHAQGSSWRDEHSCRVSEVNTHSSSSPSTLHHLPLLFLSSHEESDVIGTPRLDASAAYRHQLIPALLAPSLDLPALANTTKPTTWQHANVRHCRGAHGCPGNTGGAGVWAADRTAAHVC